MFLKNIKIKNFRKFSDSKNEVSFTYNADFNKREKEQDGQEQLRRDLAENTTLIVGKNNSGKTSIINLLKELSKFRAKQKNCFSVKDFNLNYLQKKYERYLNLAPENIMEEDLPLLYFQIEIGIDDVIKNSISSLEDVLVIEDTTSIAEFIKAQNEKSEKGNVINYPTLKIDIKYQSSQDIELKHSISELVKNYNEETILSEDIKFYLPNNEKEEVGKLPVNPTLKKLVELDENCLSEGIRKFIRYKKNEHFDKFLKIIDDATYILNFYSHAHDEPANRFSLKDFLEVKTIKANNINSENCLTRAYNKIIKTFIENQGNHDLTKLIENMNYDIKQLVDSNYTGKLNKVTQKIESSKKLQMNLKADVTIEQILNHSVRYEYQENHNYIPENQFGLGYTNLMIIIAELVDYIESYKEDDAKSKVNIIAIEEPETHMHPQMQELFINNIESAIHELFQTKDIEIPFQLIITTHSSHILNSKIHSGNTLNNINYLTTEYSNNDFGTAIITQVSDDIVIDSNVKEESDKSALLNSLEYIKKHIRLETSDLFFADAIILVEGATEKSFLNYIISECENLNKFYISVLQIDGAHGKVYFNLIRHLNIPCIVFTDIDFKRNKDKEDQDESKIAQIESFDDSVINQAKFSTNATLKYVLENKLIAADETGSLDFKRDFIRFNEYRSECDEFFVFKIDNISTYTQGKINGYYATSLEESIILENYEDDFLHIQLSNLKPNIYKSKYDKSDRERIKQGNFDYVIAKDNSYYFQSKLSDAKTKFMNNIIFESIKSKEMQITVPLYIREGLKELSKRLSGEGYNYDIKGS